MYHTRIVHVPALGKSPALRAALEERNQSGNADVPHALSQNIFSPQNAFVHALRFENLAALEAYQARPLDATFQAQSQKITECLAAERITFLYEQLTSTGRPSAPPKVLIRNRMAQAPGKGPELRALLEDRLQVKRPSLLGARLERQIGALDGPSFTVTLLFASLAAMEEHFRANETDASFASYLGKMAPLLRAPVQQRIQRVIAPFPT